MTLDVAARVTTGTSWPDGAACELGSVLLVSAEDDPSDTLRPRLDALHADCRKIEVMSMVRRIDNNGKPHDRIFTLADIDALESALQRMPGCRLIIIDPIGSFLGSNTDLYRDNQVRGVLTPLAALAVKYGVAVLVVAHRRKTGGKFADDLALGSRAFTGIARAVWHLSRDPDNKDRRLLLPGKNNLSPEGTGLAFIFGGKPSTIMWERDPVMMNADDGLALENDGNGRKRGPRPQARDAAAEWLAAELADLAEHPVATLQASAKSAGLRWRTVQRAAESLHVIWHRATFGGAYIWRLPKPRAIPAISDTVKHANIPATSADTGGSWHPGTQGEIHGKIHDSACQDPLPAKLFSFGKHGEDGEPVHECDSIEQSALMEPQI